MSWLNRNKRTPEETEMDTKAQTNSVQVVVHKNARKEVIESAKKANEQLEKLFNDNHFTITILLAAGGRVPKRKVKPSGH